MLTAESEKVVITHSATVNGIPKVIQVATKDKVSEKYIL